VRERLGREVTGLTGRGLTGRAGPGLEFAGTGHEGATYTLTEPAAITHTEIAAALSTALGRDITFSDVPPRPYSDMVFVWQPGR
jgi:uncharacterized protein YbjT (DUF2867 family)